MKKTVKIIVILVIASFVVFVFFRWENNKQNKNLASQNKKAVPDSAASSQVLVNNNIISDQPTPINSASDSPGTIAQDKPTPEEKPTQTVAEKYLLDMPFYSQAPLSKWDAFHEDMCEEASLLNAGLYLEDKKLTKDQFETELQKIQNVEKKEVGEWKSTTISQTKKWADVYFGGNLIIKIIDNPAIDDIETEISAGHPVVVPLAGRDIGNPNFTPPGPIYHMLVVKGYDSQNFITNDVGTRKGNSYAYKKAVIMKNMHDWNEKDIHLGAKRVLVLYK